MKGDVDVIGAKVKILCIADYYLPGFRAGGPIRTLSNMFVILSDRLDFKLITRDRDLGSDTPYDDVNLGEWQDQGTVSVYYASPSEFGFPAFENALASNQYDLLYLNSFFGFRSSISIYLRNRLRHRDLPLLI